MLKRYFSKTQVQAMTDSECLVRSKLIKLEGAKR
jgi:hypothetical protein